MAENEGRVDEWRVETVEYPVVLKLRNGEWVDRQGNVWARARPTASEEAIEAAAREISEKSYQGPSRPETWAVILRRHFAASEQGGEG